MIYRLPIQQVLLLPEYMQSAIYKGTIQHRRYQPVEHEFSYRMFMLYLDLDELDSVFRGSRLFSARKRALAEFRRSDHFGNPDIPLIDAVRELVKTRTGQKPGGPIRLLTHLRYFGYVFNPVSFYYCFDSHGEKVEFVVAEVNNTPWGEQHCYVLKTAINQVGPVMRFSAAKAMHVSPFMPMDLRYDWRMGLPDELLNLYMTNIDGEEKIFDATLRLKRKKLSPAALARSLAAFPFLTLKVMAAIHWQAMRLWFKKVPFHPHPALEAESQVQENTTQ